MANIKSFPNNQDEYIGAEEVMRWHHGRSSGVFGADGNAAVAPVLDTMAVTVSDGIGWLTNDKGNGIVWWVDNEAKDGSKLQLPVDIADAVMPRIDRVVVSWQTANYVALPQVMILKGTPASNPVAPALTNDNTVRQISLAAIHIPAGVTAIDAYMITDERLDESVCGIVTEKVGIDTSVMQAQFESFWAKNVAEFEAYKAQQNAELEAYIAQQNADLDAYMARQKAQWEAFLAASEEAGLVPIPAPGNKGMAVVVNENGDGYTLYQIPGEQVSAHGITTEGNGAAYTAEVGGIDTLTAGATFIMVPHTDSTTTAPTLNVNDLGAKTIRQRLNTNSGITVPLSTEGWLVAGKPVLLMYNGTDWVIEVARADANNLYGAVPVTSGGTGADTAEEARENLGIKSKTWTLTLEDGSTVTEVVCVL